MYDTKKTIQGRGFILSVPRNSLEDITSEISLDGFRAEIIGRVTNGNGNVKIKSMFGGKEIVF